MCKNNLIGIFYEAVNFTKTSDIEIMLPVKGTPALTSVQSLTSGPFNEEGDRYHLIRMWEWNLYLWVNGNAFWVGSALGSEFCVTSGVALSSSVPLILSGVKGD